MKIDGLVEIVNSNIIDKINCFFDKIDGLVENVNDNIIDKN